MPIAPGSDFHVGFTSRKINTATARDVDSVVHALLFKNGVADGAVTVTIDQAQDETAADIDGAYFANGTIPSVGYAAGDWISIYLMVNVDGVIDGEFVGSFTLSTDAGGGGGGGATAADVWAEILEGTFTAQDLMRLFAAALLGARNATDGGATVDYAFRDLADTMDRILATVSRADGARTAITLDPS